MQNPGKPLDIENKHDKYVLDLQSMMQTNKQTKTTTALWRTKAAYTQPNFQTSASPNTAIPSNDSYAWFFLDKKGWIKFGESSPGIFQINLSSDNIFL